MVVTVLILSLRSRQTGFDSVYLLGENKSEKILEQFKKKYSNCSHLPPWPNEKVAQNWLRDAHRHKWWVLFAVQMLFDCTGGYIHPLFGPSFGPASKNNRSANAID